MRSQDRRDAQVIPCVSPYEGKMYERRKEEDGLKENFLEEGKEVMAKSTKKGAYGTKKKGCSHTVMAGKAPVQKKPSGLRTK